MASYARAQLLAPTPDRSLADGTMRRAPIPDSIKQHSNERLARWLRDCAAAVGTEADLQAFLAHVQATERQYAVVAAFTPEPSSLPSSPPSSPLWAA